jgi:hypothetical protein
MAVSCSAVSLSMPASRLSAKQFLLVDAVMAFHAPIGEQGRELCVRAIPIALSQHFPEWAALGADV